MFNKILSILNSKKNKFFLIPIIFVLVYAFLKNGTYYLPVEEMSVPIGIGIDINKDEQDNLDYILSIPFYIFKEQEDATAVIKTGTGKSIGSAREDLQLKIDKRFSPGLEKIYILSDELAKNSIEMYIDSVFRDPNVNDTALLSICKEKASAILKCKINGYSNSADFIQGLIKHSSEYSFFNSEDYKLIDAFVRIDSEGRNLVLPMISIKNNQPEIIGTAVFNKYKMISYLNMNDSKLMNLLRQKNARGILSFKNIDNKSLDCYANSKRKVNCIKKDDSYVFIINLNIDGKLLNNTINKNINNNPKLKNKFEKDLNESIEKDCYRFIKKMKNELNVDTLELGKIAASKYGRNANTNWNKIICNSVIKVNVNFKIDFPDRGTY